MTNTKTNKVPRIGSWPEGLRMPPLRQRPHSPEERPKEKPLSKRELYAMPDMFETEDDR